MYKLNIIKTFIVSIISNNYFFMLRDVSLKFERNKCMYNIGLRILFKVWFLLLYFPAYEKDGMGKTEYI